MKEKRKEDGYLFLKLMEMLMGLISIFFKVLKSV